MKKNFIFTSIIVIVFLTSCINVKSDLPNFVRVFVENDEGKVNEFTDKNKSVNDLPKDLRDRIERMDEKFSTHADDLEIIYKGIRVDGQNIIISIQFSTRVLNGKTLKKGLEEEGINQETISRGMISLLKDESSPYVDSKREFAKLLCKYKYNFLVHIIGQNEYDAVTYTIMSYKDVEQHNYNWR